MSAAARVVDLGEYRKKKSTQSREATLTAVAYWVPVVFWVPFWPR